MDIPGRRFVLLDIREGDDEAEAIERFLDALGFPPDDEEQKDFHAPGQHIQDSHGNWASDVAARLPDYEWKDGKDEVFFHASAKTAAQSILEKGVLRHPPNTKQWEQAAVYLSLSAQGPDAFDFKKEAIPDPSYFNTGATAHIVGAASAIVRGHGKYTVFRIEIPEDTWEQWVKERKVGVDPRAIQDVSVMILHDIPKEWITHAKDFQVDPKIVRKVRRAGVTKDSPANEVMRAIQDAGLDPETIKPVGLAREIHKGAFEVRLNALGRGPLVCFTAIAWDEEPRDYVQRELTGPEKRVDFAAIKNIFDKDTLTVGEKLRDLVKAARDDALKAFELRADSLTADFAQAYRINVSPEFTRTLHDHLMEAWRKNRDYAIAELPSEVQGRLLDLKRYHLPGQHDQEGHGNWAGNRLPPEGSGDDRALMSLFRAVRKEDDAGVLPKGDTWADKYAASLSSKMPMPEKFKDNATLARFLQDAEFAHNADWPEYFAMVVDDELKGIDHSGQVSVSQDDPRLDSMRARMEAYYHDFAAGREDKRITQVADWLKEAKAAHGASKEPWAKWYADYLKDRLPNTKVVHDALEHAEEMHTAEWPMTYAREFRREISGQSGLTPDQQLEYDDLVERAAKIERRPERFPSQNDRRRYLALRLKRPISALKYQRLNFAASFKPDVAGNYWRNRALSIKGIVDDELTKQVKMEMFSHIRMGRSARETMGRIRDIFEPWVGDPSKIVPSGITRTPEDVLLPRRIELIVRMETATAVNEGRRMVAEAADDFVLGYAISAILDERTTEICWNADGVSFRIDDPRVAALSPPLHFNCRSILVYITTNDAPYEWSTEAELDRVVRSIPPEFK